MGGGAGAVEQAVGAEETPEGFEGLSWAAWWLDDAEAVFDARERAYRLYEEAGAAADAARMATWLASDQLDFHVRVRARGRTEERRVGSAV